MTRPCLKRAQRGPVGSEVHCLQQRCQLFKGGRRHEVEILGVRRAVHVRFLPAGVRCCLRLYDEQGGTSAQRPSLSWTNPDPSDPLPDSRLARSPGNQTTEKDIISDHHYLYGVVAGMLIRNISYSASSSDVAREGRLLLTIIYPGLSTEGRCLPGAANLKKSRGRPRHGIINIVPCGYGRRTAPLASN